MKRFELIEIVENDDGSFALLYDTQTGETVMSPIRTQVQTKRLSVIATSIVPTPEVKPSKIPQAFRVMSKIGLEEVQNEEEVVEEAVIPNARPMNPHAIARPQFAWQDPDWVSPEQRKEEQKHKPPPPIFGNDIKRIFRDPGSHEEKDTFVVKRN